MYNFKYVPNKQIEEDLREAWKNREEDGTETYKDDAGKIRTRKKFKEKYTPQEQSIRIKQLNKEAAKDMFRQYKEQAKPGKKLWLRKIMHDMTKIRYSFMLSSPTTWIKNLFGNFTMRAENRMVESIANKFFPKTQKFAPNQVSLYSKNRGVDVKIDKTISTSENTYLKFTKTGEISQNVINFIEKNYMDSSQLDILLTISRFAEAVPTQSQDHALQKAFYEEMKIGNGFWGLFGTLDKFSAFIQKMMDGPDKAFVFTDTIRIFAGLLEDSGLDVTKTDAKTTSAIKQYLVKAGIYASETYLRNDNWLSKKLVQLSEGNPTAAFILSHLQPFGKIVGNTFRHLLQFSPVGLANSMIKYKTTKNEFLNAMNKTFTPNEILTMGLFDVVNTNAVKQGVWTEEDLLKGTDIKAKTNVDGGEITLFDLATNRVNLSTLTQEQLRLISDKIPADNILKILNDPVVMSKLQLNVAKGVVGSITLLIGMLLAQFGVFDLDEEDGKMKLKIAGISIDLTDVIVTNPLVLGTAMTHLFKTGEVEPFVSMFDEMSGYSSLFSIFERSNGSIDFSQNFASLLVNQYVPGVIRQFNRVIAPNKLTKQQNWALNILQTFVSQAIPGGKYILNGIFGVEYQYDIYTGEPLKEYGDWWMNAINVVLPFKIKKADDYSDIEVYLHQLEIMSDDGWKMKETITNSFTINGEKYTMSGNEKADITKRYAETNKERLSAFFNGNLRVRVLDEKTNTYKEKTYSQMTQKEQQNAVNQIMNQNQEMYKVYYWTTVQNKKYYGSADFYKLYRQFYQSQNVYQGNKGYV